MVGIKAELAEPEVLSPNIGLIHFFVEWYDIIYHQIIYSSDIWKLCCLEFFVTLSFKSPKAQALFCIPLINYI